MDLITASGLIVQLLNASATMMSQAQQVSGLIANAHAEGRADISDAELDAVVGDNAESRAAVLAALERAEGRARPDKPNG